MVFDPNLSKSPVQRAVEETLALSASRLDGNVRRQRAKAAMVLECTLHGYSEAKIAAVAARAQISTASIYRDFGDREALLVQSLEWVIAMFAQHWVTDTCEQEPIKRIEALLLAHGTALSDPFMGWIFRLYVHLANTSAPHLLVMARAARDANLAFWSAEISKLQLSGQIQVSDSSVLVAILLGAIERRSIFARMAFGENDHHEPKLEMVAEHTALALFQVYGTKIFWQGQSGAEGVGRRALGKDVAQIALPLKPLMDMPSQRLKEYGQRVLSRDVNRLDSDGRKVRVQLAAMLECIEVGYEAATMASVAARAGVSTATLYIDYPDKKALFLDAIVLQSRFRVDYYGLIGASASKTDTIASLVYSISSVLADPDFLWFHRVSMASEFSNAPLLIQSSRDTRSHTEAFWLDYLATLVEVGFLEAHDKGLIMNLLLGATQRRSVLSMVFFGASDVSQHNIAQLACASTDFVLRLIGSRA